MTAFFAALLYLATAVLVGGLAYRILGYARTPAPLKIPTTPAPTTRGGVVLRMVREVALFESLFRSNLWTWAFGWLFHAGLALVLLRHLRYFVEPVWSWLAFVQPFGVYGGFAMAAGLAGALVDAGVGDRVVDRDPDPASDGPQRGEQRHGEAGHDLERNDLGGHEHPREVHVEQISRQRGQAVGGQGGRRHGDRDPRERVQRDEGEIDARDLAGAGADHLHDPDLPQVLGHQDVDRVDDQEAGHEQAEEADRAQEQEHRADRRLGRLVLHGDGDFHRQQAEQRRELDHRVQRHRRSVLERVADRVADDGRGVQRRPLLTHVDLDDLLRVVPRAAGVRHEQRLEQSEECDRHEIRDEEVGIEEGQGQREAEDRGEDVDHAALRVLRADLDHLLAVLDRRARRSFIQPYVRLDEFHRAVGARGHGLNRSAREPVDDRAAR